MTFRKPVSLVLSLALVAVAAPSGADRVRAQSRQSVNAHRNTNVNRNGNVNVNRNTNYNRNTNVNVNVNRDVHVHGGYYGGGCCYYNPHPVATAAAVTATAMVTAAVIGSMVNTLPSGCTTVVVNGFAYQQCGSTWYQPRISGSTTTYVVVNAPR